MCVKCCAFVRNYHVHQFPQFLSSDQLLQMDCLSASKQLDLAFCWCFVQYRGERTWCMSGVAGLPFIDRVHHWQQTFNKRGRKKVLKKNLLNHLKILAPSFWYGAVWFVAHIWLLWSTCQQCARNTLTVAMQSNIIIHFYPENSCGPSSPCSDAKLTTVKELADIVP